MKKCIFLIVAGFFAFSVTAQVPMAKTSSEDLELAIFTQYLGKHESSQAVSRADFFSSIRVETISTFDKVRAGAAFKSSARAKFLMLNGETKTPLAEKEIIVRYPEQTDTGVVLKYTNIKTDAAGLAQFSLPVFQKPILSEVTFALKLFPAETETQQSEPLEFQKLAAEELEKISASFPCKVGSAKRTGLKLTIDIADFDEKGNVFGRNMVGTALLGELMRRGYLWPGNYDSAIIRNANRPMEQVVEVAAKDFAGNVKDFIFGRAKIIKKEKVNDSWEAVCELQAQIWDMKTKTCVKEITCQATATAKTSSDAVFQARTKLGQEVLADLLEFGFEFQ